MLDPETLEDVGNLVGAVYTELEAKMCDILVKAILDNDVGFWKSQAALAMLAQAQAPQLRMVLERYKDKISKATYREVEEALTKSDDNDLNRLQEALGYEIPRISTVQITNAAQKIGEMLERDNLDMLTGARQTLYREVSVAIAQVTGGLMSPHEATWAATRRLARNGISVVQYKDPTTGKKTVRNKVDVAVRRHVRSQMAQAAAERTMQVCQSTGCGFVEVSSHVGARPSHQDWEGRVYSLNGRVTVDGVTYEDFGEATGYYGEGDHGALGDRLQGVNCRHHFGPWLPGMPRAYHPNPQHPSGKSNDEIYKLTQKQRRMERDLRDTKRELSAALENYKRYPNEKTQLAVNQLKAQLKSQNDKMKAFLAENKGILTRQPARESVGDMPRVKVPAATQAASAQSRERAEKALALQDKCLRRRQPIFDDGLLGRNARAAFNKIGRDGGYNVVSHGTPEVMTPFGVKADHKLMARIIRNRDDYEGGPVRLLSCSTGDDSGDAPCFAQRLADELGVTVTAPDGILWVYPDGTLEIGAIMGHNTGEFKQFSPRKRRWRGSTGQSTETGN